MARETKRLNSRSVATLTKPGRHADGDGLYLVIDKTKAGEEGVGAKRWVYLFRDRGRLREMGLGGVGAVDLKVARAKAERARRDRDAGLDPIEASKRDDSIPTFGSFADELIADLTPGWRNPKSGNQWTNTLKDYASDLRAKRVNEVTTEDVLDVLKPIWSTKSETAAKVRGRIERILDAAKAKGYRSGENPARWRGHLDHLLPKRQRLSRGHHPAMQSAAIRDFLTQLRTRDAVAAWALEFTILTAARSGEVLGALWSEIDIEAKVWTIPGNRMKAGREHRVPLSEQALKILARARVIGRSDYVFPGARKGRPLSGMAMAMLLRRMKLGGFTVHGFRSTFRDWAGEHTAFPRELAEAALAHTIGDETERAYRRGDALERRRKLMEAWATFCAPKGRANQGERAA